MLEPCRRALAALALIVAAPLGAHEFWMLPGSFHLPPGQSTTLSLAVGEDFAGEPVAFTPVLVARLRHFSAAGATDVAARTLPGAVSPGIEVRLPRSGAHLFALDTHPQALTLEPDKFNAYLRQEGLEQVLAARERAGTSAAPARERFRRHAKTLVRAGPAGDATWRRRTGQRLEIVPAADPSALRAPSSLTLQVWFDARPLPGALVKLWNGRGAEGLQLQQVTDARGRVTLALPRDGSWMASVVHMVPAAGPDFDWDSFWGNLTFELPATVPPQDPAGSRAPRR